MKKENIVPKGAEQHMLYVLHYYIHALSIVNEICSAEFNMKWRIKCTFKEKYLN